MPWTQSPDRPSTKAKVRVGQTDRPRRVAANRSSRRVPPHGRRGPLKRVQTLRVQSRKARARGVQRINFSSHSVSSDTRPSSCAPSSLGVPDAAVGVGAGLLVSVHRASRLSGRGDGGLSASGSTSGSGPVDQPVWAERELARRVVPPAGSVVVGNKFQRTSYSTSSGPTTQVAGPARRHFPSESVSVRVGAQHGASAIPSTPPEAAAFASGRRSRSDQAGRVALGEGLRTITCPHTDLLCHNCLHP